MFGFSFLNKAKQTKNATEKLWRKSNIQMYYNDGKNTQVKQLSIWNIDNNQCVPGGGGGGWGGEKLVIFIKRN